MSAEPASLTELRRALAPAIAEAAVFDGWTEAAIEAAATARAIDPAAAVYAFSTDGTKPAAMAMIAAWVESIDAAMAEALPADKLATMKVRARIRALVLFRLDAVRGQREALRRALAIMAMPQNAPQALRLGWRSADAMWRLAGDVAADYNHYTKRMTLGALYAATLAVYADDQSEGAAETHAFLDRRIDGVMKFEAAKAKWLGGNRDHFSPARFFGRLRYPAR